MKIRQMVYTKDNGDSSKRVVAVISEPRENYLTLDLSKLTSDEIRYLKKLEDSVVDFREECYTEFEEVTGHKISSLWRSFKPGGIEWVTENDEI